eukprot:3515827-Pyramimonas_sp.AAC.1
MVVGRFWNLPGGFGRLGDRRLGTSGSRKEENPKCTKNLHRITVFSLLGPSSECSWRPLATFWSDLSGYERFLERSCAVLGVSGTFPATPLIALGVLRRLGKTPCEAQGAASRPAWR